MFIAAAGEHGLHAVLDVLHGDGPVLYLALEVGRGLYGEEVYDAVVILGAGGLKGLLDGAAYLADIEIDEFSVSLFNPVHLLSSCILNRVL